MIVERIWVDNPLRNFNYVVACAETGEALAIDPLDFKACLAVARDRGWDVRQVLNTHEHPDHIGGNKGMIAATDATLIAHENAAGKIRGVDRGVGAGDVIRVGKTIELECLDTPGHTMCHICLLAHAPEPALFSGDTLFNAGAGNCHNGGHPEALYETFRTQLTRIDESAKLYPGHDYWESNLRFTLDREPGNTVARERLAALNGHTGDRAAVATLGEEKTYNPFFRLHEPGVVETLRARFDDLPADPDEKTVFLKLRELRNQW